MHKSIEKNDLMKILLNLTISLLFANLMSISYAKGEAKVKISVNNIAITDNDIQQRAALLRLQHQTGNLDAKAKQQLIEQELQHAELKARDIWLTGTEIDHKYQDFATKNHMTVAQLSMMLLNAGVRPEHFKNYIATQLGWQELVVLRYRAENGNNGMISKAETIQREIASGGTKPEVAEYNLQKIIFVIPDHPNARAVQQAKNNAAYFKKHFSGCEASRMLATKLQDVIVQDIGRILAPQLPDEWKQAVSATRIGHLTSPIQSPEGLIALGICAKRMVSDDRVAQLVYSMKDSQKNSPKQLRDLSDKYMAELKARARIVNF